jgi:hypothetical protein
VVARTRTIHAFGGTRATRVHAGAPDDVAMKQP